MFPLGGKITEERGMRLGKDVNFYLAEVAIPLISNVQMQKCLSKL